MAHRNQKRPSTSFPHQNRHTSNSEQQVQQEVNQPDQFNNVHHVGDGEPRSNYVITYKPNGVRTTIEPKSQSVSASQPHYSSPYRSFLLRG